MEFDAPGRSLTFFFFGERRPGGTSIMDSQTAQDITRHIRRMCVVDDHSTWVEDDVPPERRYEETATLLERLKRRVGIIRRIYCNSPAIFCRERKNGTVVSNRAYNR
jgi:hypothetical protein